MSAIPKINYLAVWRSMPVEARNAIGCLLLEERLLRVASEVYIGEGSDGCIVYLEEDERHVAKLRAEELAGRIAAVIAQDLPEYFGEDPTKANPLGTDPAWAIPMLRPIPFEYSP